MSHYQKFANLPKLYVLKDSKLDFIKMKKRANVMVKDSNQDVNNFDYIQFDKGNAYMESVKAFYNQEMQKAKQLKEMKKLQEMKEKSKKVVHKFQSFSVKKYMEKKLEKRRIRQLKQEESKYKNSSGITNSSYSKLPYLSTDRKSNNICFSELYTRCRGLIASLMDLTSGSGDKATPVVLVQNYF